jgi:hypothetical protein
MVGHTGFLTTARRIEPGPARNFKSTPAGEADDPAEEE